MEDWMKPIVTLAMCWLALAIHEWFKKRYTKDGSERDHPEPMKPEGR